MAVAGDFCNRTSSGPAPKAECTASLAHRCCPSGLGPRSGLRTQQYGRGTTSAGRSSLLVPPVNQQISLHFRLSVVRRINGSVCIIYGRPRFRASPFSSDIFLVDKTSAADAFVRRSITCRLVSVGFWTWLGRFHRELQGCGSMRSKRRSCFRATRHGVSKVRIVINRR